jgi:hypothetical protein
MRFLCVYKPDQPEATPPTQQQVTRMGELVDEMTRAGVLLTGEGCLPTAKGARVRRAGDKITVKDGPFTESKELIAGFALIQVKSIDEAIEWTKRFLDAVGDGESEIRQLHEATDFAPGP